MTILEAAAFKSQSQSWNWNLQNDISKLFTAHSYVSDRDKIDR